MQLEAPERRPANGYRGRLAPSPTGLLHLGHAQTFWIAYQRALANQGVLILRNEDLDATRSKPAFVRAMLEDLSWLGIRWQEGPDCGGPFGPYTQSQRLQLYRAAMETLRQSGAIYPCTCSRQDVLRALQAPHSGEEEPIYPGTCRPKENSTPPRELEGKVNWRFRVTDGEAITFKDGFYGPQRFVAGQDFGDFVVWRHDDSPAYHLAVVVDDAAMRITEVVRGADLLTSTARQLLLYRAFNFEPPTFYHCPLLTDASGKRLAKRHDALSLKQLREQAISPEQVRSHFSNATNGQGATVPRSNPRTPSRK